MLRSYSCVFHGSSDPSMIFLLFFFCKHFWLKNHQFHSIATCVNDYRVDKFFFPRMRIEGFFFFFNYCEEFSFSNFVRRGVGERFEINFFCYVHRVFFMDLDCDDFFSSTFRCLAFRIWFSKSRESSKKFNDFFLTCEL